MWASCRMWFTCRQLSDTSEQQQLSLSFKWQYLLALKDKSQIRIPHILHVKESMKALLGSSHVYSGHPLWKTLALHLLELSPRIQLDPCPTGEDLGCVPSGEIFPEYLLLLPQHILERRTNTLKVLSFIFYYIKQFNIFFFQLGVS